MNPKIIVRLCVDIGMTAVLLVLMAYELIGQAAHEWLGIGMFVLFLIHHILNRKWSRNLMRGKYTPLRILQTILVCFVLISMIGSMISGIILSRHALSFLPIHVKRSFARSLHMLSAYWGFVLMSLHLGFHWNMIIRMTNQLRRQSTRGSVWCSRIIALMIASYGAYAFVKRDIGDYMLLKSQFVFFNFEEPLILFLLDYLFITGTFVWVGHYLRIALQRISTHTR